MKSILNFFKKITLKKVIKYILFSISAAVYIIFFIRFFISCDSKISDNLYLDKEERAWFEDLSKELALYNYQPESWTSEDGTVQIKNIFYIDKMQKLQLTVRSRDDVYNPDGEDYPFTFRIRVKEEKEISLVPEVITDTRYGYTYARVMCNGITCENGEKVIIEVETFDEKGNSVISNETETRGGNEIFLDIFNLDGERLYTFRVAGKNVSNMRIRRSTVDVIEIN